jgi:uncharacterized protein (TIRG00374 family)
LKKTFYWLKLHKTWQKIGMLVIIGLAVHLILPQISALGSSWQVLSSMALWAVGLAFLAQIISYLGSGFMLKSVLAIAHQNVSLWRNTLIVLASFSIGMVAGGVIGSSAAIYRWTTGGKGSMEGATLASLFLPQFNTGMLLLISIIGMVHLLVIHSLTTIQLIGFLITVLILGLIMGSTALAMRYRNQSAKVILWTAEWIARLRRKSFDPDATRRETSDLYRAWDALWHGAWHRPVFGAFLNVAFDILTLYFLFLAAGQNISLGVLLAGYGLPLLLGKVAFIIPGGVGVVESSMAVLYNGLGVPQATTVIVVLGYRVISFWLPSLAGFPIAAYLQRSRGRTPKKPDALDLVV